MEDRIAGAGHGHVAVGGAVLPGLHQPIGICMKDSIQCKLEPICGNLRDCLITSPAEDANAGHGHVTVGGAVLPGLHQPIGICRQDNEGTCSSVCLQVEGGRACMHDQQSSAGACGYRRSCPSWTASAHWHLHFAEGFLFSSFWGNSTLHQSLVAQRRQCCQNAVMRLQLHYACHNTHLQRANVHHSRFCMCQVSSLCILVFRTGY